MVVSLGRGTAQRGIDRLIMRARGRQMGQTAPRAVIRAFLAFCSLCTSGTASLAAFSFLTLVPKDVARYNNIPHYAMALCLAVLISVFGAFFTHQTLHTHIHSSTSTSTPTHVVGYSNSSATLASVASSHCVIAFGESLCHRASLQATQNCQTDFWGNMEKER